MIFTLIYVVLGIYLGQEYSSYIPNVKLLTVYSLNYINQEIHKKNEKTYFMDFFNKYTDDIMKNFKK